MTSVAEWRAQLEQEGPARWTAFLDANSGLPGPRGNIELATAFAQLADLPLAARLSESPDEYRAFCGTVTLGIHVAEPGVEQRLLTLATDPRWRVREAVAMGLQFFGDRHPDDLRRIVLEWSTRTDGLVLRAAAAAICEPRLLGTQDAAATAIEVCRRGTGFLAAQPLPVRRAPSLRTLRKGLGYCWSVAVAADPGPGLAAFRSLDATDPDVAWIVRQNEGKKRLQAILDAAG